MFRAIEDVFRDSKEVDYETVRRKYQLENRVGCVGRMVDSLESSKPALSRKRFLQELRDERFSEVPSRLENDGGELCHRASVHLATH